MQTARIGAEQGDERRAELAGVERRVPPPVDLDLAPSLEELRELIGGAYCDPERWSGR